MKNTFFAVPFTLNAWINLTPEQVEKIAAGDDSSVKTEIEENMYLAAKACLLASLNNDTDLRNSFSKDFEKEFENLKNSLNENGTA